MVYGGSKGQWVPTTSERGQDLHHRWCTTAAWKSRVLQLNKIKTLQALHHCFEFSHSFLLIVVHLNHCSFLMKRECNLVQFQWVSWKFCPRVDTSIHLFLIACWFSMCCATAGRVQLELLFSRNPCSRPLETVMLWGHTEMTSLRDVLFWSKPAASREAKSPSSVVDNRQGRKTTPPTPSCWFHSDQWCGTGGYKIIFMGTGIQLLLWSSSDVKTILRWSADYSRQMSSFCQLLANMQTFMVCW